MWTIAAVVVALAAVAPARAQEPAPREVTAIPLEVEVTISRYQADKKVSSVPYLLAVNAGRGETSLNMGAEVPVPTTAIVASAAGDKPAAPFRSFNYRPIGTRITANASPMSDGRFELFLGIDESSLATTGAAGTAEPVMPETPIFRNFQTRNTLLLRDGQTRQYTAATDRVTGEVVRVDVTLRVAK
jgi:hypothetical protein